MIINIENKGTYLHVSHFDKEGKVAYVDVPIKEEDRYNWERCGAADRYKDPEYKTWEGHPVKKVKTLRYDKYRIVQLLEEAPREITQPLWDGDGPNKYFVDIEVEVTDEASDSLNTEAVKNRVLSIGIATDKCKLIVLGLVDLTSRQISNIQENVNNHLSQFEDEWTVQYYSFKTEYDMLYTFFKNIAPKMAVVTGWNWFGYDWPYLINRAKKLHIDPTIVSPAGNFVGKNSIPMHLLMVDYLEIYKKWDRVIKIKESNKLDYVAEKALGIKKIEYDKSLRELYRDDKEKFMLYNAIDCALLHYIDQKLKTMQTLFDIAQLNGVEVDRAFSPVWSTEVLMLKEILKRKQVFTYEKRDEVHVKFTGGYVKEPIKGLHSWVACYDFASLYPNTMVQWGISPEVYKGKNISSPKDTWIKTSSGAYFGGEDEDPILRRIIKDFYGRRRKAKDTMLAKKAEIEKLKKELEKLT